MINVNYNEFLKLPDIEAGFASMYEKQKENFRQRCSSGGFDKVHLDLVSMKSAMISTDLYYTDLHRQEKTEDKKD